MKQNRIRCLLTVLLLTVALTLFATACNSTKKHTVSLENGDIISMAVRQSGGYKFDAETFELKKNGSLVAVASFHDTTWYNDFLMDRYETIGEDRTADEQLILFDQDSLGYMLVLYLPDSDTSFSLYGLDYNEVRAASERFTFTVVTSEGPVEPVLTLERVKEAAAYLGMSGSVDVSEEFPIPEYIPNQNEEFEILEDDTITLENGDLYNINFPEDSELLVFWDEDDAVMVYVVRDMQPLAVITWLSPDGYNNELSRVARYATETSYRGRSFIYSEDLVATTMSTKMPSYLVRVDEGATEIVISAVSRNILDFVASNIRITVLSSSGTDVDLLSLEEARAKAFANEIAEIDPDVEFEEPGTVTITAGEVGDEYQLTFHRVWQPREDLSAYYLLNEYGVGEAGVAFVTTEEFNELFDLIPGGPTKEAFDGRVFYTGTYNHLTMFALPNPEAEMQVFYFGVTRELAEDAVKSIEVTLIHSDGPQSAVLDDRFAQ